MPTLYPPSFFIESELRRTGLELHYTRGHIMIPCPFHREEHPSLSIAVDSDKIQNGVYHCFGCQQSGVYNKLAKCMGLRLWNAGKEEDDPLFIYKTKKEVKKEILQNGYSLSTWTDEYKWKSYKAKFLSRFGAKLLFDKKVRTKYLYLPLEYMHDMYGYCKVRLREKDFGSKYWFNPGITKPLYPIDYIIDNVITNCVCLVEGIADSLRLIKYGIPALAILGSSMTSFMMEQLELLAIKNIILCLDGDEAGRNASLGTKESEGLAQKLDKEGYNVRMFIPPEGSDPDSMPVKYVHYLGKFCEKLKGPKYKYC